MDGVGVDSASARAWAALEDGGADGRPGAGPGSACPRSPVRHVGSPGLAARLPVAELARACVTVCALAAAEYHRPGAAVRVDDAEVAAAFTSERHLTVSGRAPVAFAPLSRFWRTADGHVRTHANYPHHRARLLSLLGVTDREDEAALVAAVGDALVGRRAEDVEEAAAAAGALAVAVRDRSAWTALPQGVSAAAHPLPALTRLDERGAPPPRSPGALRVLDLTRVIAGPVATRTLALIGADVLRIDAPQLPESPGAHADTGFGKRSTLLDLGRRADRATFEELLGQAHVVVTGYRPGALDRFGLDPRALAERRPGLVAARLSAWGEAGPWSSRRGFDSLVQAATGIAVAEGTAGEPGALPAQALDHGTGYLLAAAVLRALAAQRRGAVGSRLVRASLAGTASWLMTGVAHRERPPADPGGAPATVARRPRLRERDSPLGRLRYVPSPVRYEGGAEDWAAPPGVLGTDSPAWRGSGPPTPSAGPNPGGAPSGIRR